MINYLCSLLFLIALFHPFQSSGQDLSFVNYSTKEGMSSAQVYQMFQDVNGDILFATDRGITKYDGYDFQTLDLDDGLTNMTIFKFFPQSDGNIWCSTIDNSWFYFKNGTLDFKPCKLNPLIQKESLGVQPEDLWIDKDSAIHVSFEGMRDYLKINLKTKKVEHPVDQFPFGCDSTSAIFIKTKTWFTFNTLLEHVNLNEWKSFEKVIITKPIEISGFQKMEVINDHFLQSSGKNLVIKNAKGKELSIDFNLRILGLGSLDKNHFWISFLEGGIKIFTMNGLETQHWLKERSVTNLFVDRNNGIWVSTLTNGVYYAQSNKLKLYPKLKGQFIFSIGPGINNEPLVCSFKQTYQYNSKTLEAIPIEFLQENLRCVYDQLTEKYFRLVNAELVNSKIKSVLGHSILDFNENTELPLLISSPLAIIVQRGKMFDLYRTRKRITAIEHAENGFLVGRYNGLDFFNLSDHTFNTYTHKALQGRIKDIKFKNGIHFIGTNESGLVKYNQKTDEVIQITTNEGLASNLINEVYAESESIVWVATNLGLDRVTFNITNLIVEHFGTEDGLIDNDINDVYVHNNTIWIGTRSGLCSISKDDFETTSTTATLNLFWNKILSQNQEVSDWSNIVLKHDQNNLELNFHSTFYGGRSRVKYRYKLSGTDDTWYDLSSRKIILNKLQSGNHTVVLQAKIDDGDWEKNQIETKFTILPPFYKTWWFRAIIVTLITTLIYLFFKFRVFIYNRSLVKEFLRLIIRKINPKIKSFIIKEQGISHRINSMDVVYLKSEGNYLIIQLEDKRFTIRYKIGEYSDLVPDKLEYIRVHKSYVVRIDKISGKNIGAVYLKDIEIPIGLNYKKNLKELTI